MELKSLEKPRGLSNLGLRLGSLQGARKRGVSAKFCSNLPPNLLLPPLEGRRRK